MLGFLASTQPTEFNYSNKITNYKELVMNTKSAIALLTGSQNNLTKFLAALGLLNNGEIITSLQTKVDQSIKNAQDKYQQLSSQFDIIDANLQITNEQLTLAFSHNTTEQERLLELKKQQTNVNNSINNLNDKKEIIGKNGDSKKAEIKGEIDAIKTNIAKTELEVNQIKQQVEDGLKSIADYNQFTQQYNTAQDRANYHNQYVQKYVIVRQEKGKSGKTNDIWGWVPDADQIRLRDGYQQQANTLKQQANGLKPQVDSFNKNLPVLKATEQSKTDQIWLYYNDLNAKTNLLSFNSTSSDQDLALIDLQISQAKTDLQQLEIIDIPTQEKTVQTTTQRVNDVQSAADKLKIDKASAQKNLDDFVNRNQDLLATDVSLDFLKNVITDVIGKIATLQAQLVQPNQTADTLKVLNQDIIVQQGKLDQLKQHYQLLTLEKLDVNQQRLQSFNSQLAAENSVDNAITVNTIQGYADLLPQLIQQAKGLSDIWVENLKTNHKLTVDISDLFQNNLTSFNELADYIEKNLATPDINYSLDQIQLDEAIAIQDTQVKYRDVLAKTVDDLQENIELQKKSVQQGEEIAGKLQHLQNLVNYEQKYATLKNLALQPLIELSWLQSAVINPNNGHLYLLTGAKTWTEAQSEATKLGGNLVSINNAEEQQWLWKTFSIVSNYWIGLKRNLSNNSWQWVNGEAATYFNWDPDEPNNAGGIENYGMIIGSQDAFYDQGKWNDYSDTNSLRGNGIRGIIEIASQAVLDQKIKEQQQWIEIKAQGADISTKLISELDQEISNKISDLPNQLDLPNDQQEQLIETNLQKYVQQKEDDIFKIQSEQLASIQKTFQQPTRALYFDGVNDYINVGVKPSLEVSNAITIEVWVKPQKQLQLGGGYLVSRQGEYEVSIDTNGTIKWAFANANPGWLTINTGYAIKTGEWTHIAVSYDNGLVNTYVNGTLVHTYKGSGIIGDHPLLASLDEFRIGNIQYGNSLLFKGEIDEVRVWNVTRTQTEIVGAYNRTLTGKEQGLAGYWNFEETSGNTVNDLTANNNQGTLTNGVQRTVDNLIPVKYQPSNALYFDGVNDYVNAGTDPSLKVTTNLTIEAWINPQQDARTRIIVGREGEYLLALSGADNTIFYAIANTNPGYNWTSTGYAVKSNEWSHITFSFDNGRIKTYINGQLVYTYDGIGTIGDINSQQDDLRIGNRQINGSDFFKGQIDQVRVWNTTKTQAEIQANLSQTLTGQEQGLVGAWNFEESSGNIVYDATGNNHGFLTNRIQRTFANLNPITRPQGNALYFDGINDYISAGSKPNLEMTNSFTLEAWIKPQQNSQQGVIVGREGEYRLAIGTDNRIHFAIANTNPSWTWINTGYAVNLNQWSHVSLSYDNGLIKTYINGELVYTYEGSGVIGDYALHANQDDLRIGNREWANLDSFKGEMDEVRVWNVARTQAQIQASISQKLTGKEQGLVGYWNFEETSGNTANDLTANSNQGTLVNGVQRTVDNLIPVKYPPSKALYFDGVNDYVNAGTDPSLKVTTNLTLEAWINPQQDSRTRIIVGREGEYLLALSGADNTIFYAIANTNPGYNWTSTGYAVKSNEWSHITFSFDNGRIKTYVNGQLVYTYDGVGTIGDVNSQQDELRIGNRQVNGSEFFKGQIDEVRVWNTTRTQAQIQANLSQTLTGKEQGLVGVWNFEEASGQIVSDATTNNNNGMLMNGVQRTIVNSTEVKYQPSRALYFDGVNDSVKVTDSSALNLVNQWTLESWIFRNGTGRIDPIIEKYNWQSGFGGFVLRVGDTNKLIASVINGTSSNSVESGITIDAQQWYHVAATFDASRKTLKLYVNGVLVGVNSDVTISPLSSNVSLKIGTRGDDSGRYFNGQIDDTRVWNVARTQAEIQANFSQKLTGKEQGLVGYWNFEESIGNTVNDLTSNKNNGTINGAQRTVDSSVGVPQFIDDQTNLANSKTISDLETLRLEIAHLTLQSQNNPNKVQQFLQEYNASDKTASTVQSLRNKYFPELNQATTLANLQTQINKEIDQSQQQIAQVKASITQKQAESAAALSQATWYEQEAATHWQLSRKSGPTWTEQRSYTTRTWYGRKKTKWTTVTHVDQNWIIWDTYTKQAASFRERAANLFKGIEINTTQQNTASDILKQWQDASSIADQTAITQDQLSTLLNQLDAKRQLNGDKQQQIADWEKLLPTLQTQLQQAITDAETAKNNVTKEWTEYTKSKEEYQTALNDVLTRRTDLKVQGQQLLQEMNGVKDWVTQQSTLLNDEISQADALITQLKTQRDATTKQLSTATGNAQTNLLTLQNLLNQSIELLTQKQVVLTSQQSTFIQKQTLLNTQKQVLETQYQLLDAYLESPDKDTTSLEKLLTDTRATLSQVQKLAEQAEASSNALTALMDDVQASLLLQNDKYLSVIRDKQQKLEDLLAITELKENNSLKATQKQLELNALNTTVNDILKKANDAGSQEAAKLLEVVRNNDMATSYEIIYRDYQDLASDKGGWCVKGIARPEDRQIAANAYNKMLEYRKLKADAQQQVAQFTQLRTLAESQLNILKQQETLAAKELADLKLSIGNNQEQINAKQEELAIAQFRVDALSQLRNWTEQTRTIFTK